MSEEKKYEHSGEAGPYKTEEKDKKKKTVPKSNFKDYNVRPPDLMIDTYVEEYDDDDGQMGETSENIN